MLLRVKSSFDEHYCVLKLWPTISFCAGPFLSFLSFSSRATQIKTYSWDNAQVILVGNKCDVDEERVVPFEKGKHLADQLGELCLKRVSLVP